jgi:hypothetical protein
VEPFEHVGFLTTHGHPHERAACISKTSAGRDRGVTFLKQPFAEGHIVDSRLSDIEKEIEA